MTYPADADVVREVQKLRLATVIDDTELLHAAISENDLALEAEADHLTRLILDGAPAELIEAVAVTVREHTHTARVLRQSLKTILAG